MDIRRIRAEMRMGRSFFDLPLRVTFYARVSTDQDEQLNSLENQVQYYTELIKSKPNWTFVPGYIDEGISGTSTKKRDDFNRMIRDAKAGLFDFIITKEISRFSRSTLDSIKYTQELLEHNVGVFFQNDNINTLDTDSEFRLVIMAGVAQDEVRKLSERLKFGFRQAIKNGHVLGNDRLYGYDKKDCVLTINEEEAEIVRIIFDLYANHRLGTRKISQKLFEMGYTSREGNAFNVLTIRHMLENPKYKGWYCGNKTQNLDYPSFFIQHIPIDLTGGQIGKFIQILVDKPFIVPQIQIGFRTVFRNIDLSVLIGAHGAWVHIDIGVQLLGCYLQSSGLQQAAQGRCCDALSQAGNHTAGHKNILCHD